jgi:APA family basic amino acid/polyamine antiporter
MWMNLFRRKSVAASQAEATTDNSLKRTLGAWNLTMLGIGAIVGTGAFVLTGMVASQNAGPAVTLSFLIAGIASVFAALCYAELASVVPIAGSAYTYGYVTFGELIAWIIGWDLILEYALGAATVAIGWSGYVVSFLRDIGITVPCAYSAARGVVVGCADGTSATAVANVPAAIVIAIATALLVIGIKQSATVNNIIVLIKVAVIMLFIVGAARAVSPANWHPFIPAAKPSASGGEFGWSGVMTGSALIFFAYIGFDAVSTAAQEAKNPQRDLPIGIIASLLFCAALYMMMSAVATGVVSYTKLDVPDPLAVAADAAGLGWMSSLIKFGAIMGLSSVILVMLLGQSRVFYAMGRDGLLPAFASKVHPSFRTPYLASIVTGVAVALSALILPLADAANLVAIGTLLAFVIVSIGVMVLRYREPNLERAFRTPALHIVAPVGAFSALYLMYNVPSGTKLLLVIWLLIGLLIFALYGLRHSKLNRVRDGDEHASVQADSGLIMLVVGAAGLAVIYAAQVSVASSLYGILMGASAVVAAAGGIMAWLGHLRGRRSPLRR